MMQTETFLHFLPVLFFLTTKVFASLARSQPFLSAYVEYIVYILVCEVPRPFPKILTLYLFKKGELFEFK